MNRHHAVRQQLAQVEHVLREQQLWQQQSPDEAAYASTQPFCMDTLEPAEWLQWVLIPRLHHMLDAQAPLPTNFAVAPYYEMALDASHPARGPLLTVLLELDVIFAGDAR